MPVEQEVQILLRNGFKCRAIKHLLNMFFFEE